MNCIVNGKIITPSGVVEDKCLLYDTRIKGLVDEKDLPSDVNKIDAGGKYVAPGLIDIHIHGYLGEDTSDGSAEGVETMASGIIKNGVTSFLPTTMTVSQKEIDTALDAVRSVKEKSESWKGTRILGVNLEGPFINPKKKGAQAEENIQKPNAEFIEKNQDIIKILTLAPEMDDDCKAIKEICEKTSVKVSIGHSDATFEEAMNAIDCGASHITHLFNAQSALNHRKPGIVGAAMLAPVTTELIADTFHVHAGLFQFVVNNKGDKLCLISDCTRAGGMPDGEYTLGGQKIFVNGIQCLLEDGTIAGSVLKLNNAVKNLKNNTNLSIADAINCASLNPAKAIGVEKEYGSLEEGKFADIIIVDEDINVFKTIVAGEIKYEA